MNLPPPPDPLTYFAVSLPWIRLSLILVLVLLIVVIALYIIKLHDSCKYLSDKFVPCQKYSVARRAVIGSYY